jgi:hypothetical protein
MPLIGKNGKSSDWLWDWARRRVLRSLGRMVSMEQWRRPPEWSGLGREVAMEGQDEEALEGFTAR